MQTQRHAGRHSQTHRQSHTHTHTNRYRHTDRQTKSGVEIKIKTQGKNETLWTDISVVDPGCHHYIQRYLSNEVPDTTAIKDPLPPVSIIPFVLETSGRLGLYVCVCVYVFICMCVSVYLSVCDCLLLSLLALFIPQIARKCKRVRKISLKRNHQNLKKNQIEVIRHRRKKNTLFDVTVRILNITNTMNAMTNKVPRKQTNCWMLQK